MLIAVLNDTSACFRKYGHSTNRRAQRLFEEAETWIMCQARQRIARDGGAA